MAPVDKSKVVKPLKPKSMIWPYYEDKLDGAHVLCKVCKDQHGREHQVKVPGGSTSSMIFHLRQHKNEFKKYIHILMNIVIPRNILRKLVKNSKENINFP